MDDRAAGFGGFGSEEANGPVVDAAPRFETGHDAAPEPAPAFHADSVPDPSTLSLPDLEARLTELAGHLNAAEHRFLVLLAEFDRRESWADGSTHSCAHWLSWKCGIDMNTARERVRVARALADLPRIDTAMSRGALSYSKARALTRVATPETEDTLLMIALHGTANHVESVVRGFRRAQQAALLEREARQQAARGLTWYWDDDGTLRMKACLPAEEGALVLKALQRALDEEDRAARSEVGVSAETSGAASEGDARAAGVSVETPGPDAVEGEAPFPSSGPTRADRAGDAPACDVSAETPPHRPDAAARVNISAETPARRGSTRIEPAPSFAQRRADALVRFAESWLARGDAALTGGERQQIVVHVDARTLVADAEGRSELDDEGPVLSAETVRRLGCDASIVAIVEDAEGEILDVGRKTRSIPPAIARALRSRDRCCRFPGCTNRRYVDAHHVEHWAHGGETRLSNLVLLCRRHHRQVHEGGVRVKRLDDGALVFTDAAGRRIEAAPPMAGHADRIVAHHHRHGPSIDPDTAVTQWRGERLDLGLAVAGLCDAQERAERRRASPSTG